MPCDGGELFSPEDLPVTEEDIRVLRQLRLFTPEENFAGCRPFSLEDAEGEG